MKTAFVIFNFIVLTLITALSQAQTIVTFKVSPNVTLSSVRDNNSLLYGLAENENNINGIGFAGSIDLPLNDNFYFSSGVWYTQKNISIRNTILIGSGTSKYNLSYFQVPALLKYRTGRLFTDKLNLVFGAGPILDFKIKEAVSGKDGAHYLNLAKNNISSDPLLGNNGNNKAVALFVPINYGLYLSTGAEYQLFDQIGFTAGFSINPSFRNQINPKLTYNNIDKTPVKSDLVIRTNVVSFDLGVKITLD